MKPEGTLPINSAPFTKSVWTISRSLSYQYTQGEEFLSLLREKHINRAGFHQDNT
jgi:hypothetical protein